MLSRAAPTTRGGAPLTHTPTTEGRPAVSLANKSTRGAARLATMPAWPTASTTPEERHGRRVGEPRKKGGGESGENKGGL